MSNKTFLQITALLLMAAALFYVVCPKYSFYRTYIRQNAITGKSERFQTEIGKWVSLEKIHKRPSLNAIFTEEDFADTEQK